jgi:hypothetical protein
VCCEPPASKATTPSSCSLACYEHQRRSWPTSPSLGADQHTRYPNTTILGIYSQDAGPQRPLAVRTYPSTKYPSLEAIVREFLATVHLPVDQACFDLAGPISGGRATLTNLPWEPIEEPALAEALGLDSSGC